MDTVDTGNRTHVLVVVHTAGESSVQPQVVLPFNKTIERIEKLHYEIRGLLSFEISCAKD